MVEPNEIYHKAGTVTIVNGVHHIYNAETFNVNTRRFAFAHATSAHYPTYEIDGCHYNLYEIQDVQSRRVVSGVLILAQQDFFTAVKPEGNKLPLAHSFSLQYHDGLILRDHITWHETLSDASAYVSPTMRKMFTCLTEEENFLHSHVLVNMTAHLENAVSHLSAKLQRHWSIVVGIHKPRVAVLELGEFTTGKYNTVLEYLQSVITPVLTPNRNQYLVLIGGTGFTCMVDGKGEVIHYKEVELTNVK